MFPARSILLGLSCLFCCRSGFAQMVVNSKFVNTFPKSGYDAYNDPSHWNPAEVPNNTAAKQFNVSIAAPFLVHPEIDATISNLTLSGATSFAVYGQLFTVTEATASQDTSGEIVVESRVNRPATFNAGTLSMFANQTLSGSYVISTNSAPSVPALLQFRGANISNLSNASLSVSGTLAAVVDEFGNDALRNLARLEPSGTITLNGHSVVTNAPFFNEGTLSVSSSFFSSNSVEAFTAAAGLRNFDASTGTMAGGKFYLNNSELRFDGANVLNLASFVSLSSSTGRIVDLAGKDGLRNLKHILPGGVLQLSGHDFTSAGSFTNDGTLIISTLTFAVAGDLINFDAASRTLTGGTYSITSFGTLKFNGADIVHNQASIELSQATITDLAGNNALRNFVDNGASGSFLVDAGQLFTAPGNFTNAGIVTTDVPLPSHDMRTDGEIRVPAGSAYIQTAGTTMNAGRLTAENVNILGGTFYNKRPGVNLLGTPYSGSLNGNLNISNGTLVPGGHITGNLILGTNARFHSSIGQFVDSIFIPGSTSLGGTLEVELTGSRVPANSEVLTILQSSGPMSGTFSNAPNGARIKTTDGGGSFVVVYESNAIKLTSFEISPQPAQLLNISTRATLSRADDDPDGDESVLIGGFIISGTEAKKVVIRGIGPSLLKAGVNQTLLDPKLELHAADGSTIAVNNDWRDSQEAELIATGLAPQDDREAALVRTLAPGTYTVVILEKNGSAGTGLVEVYDISGSGNSKLANISTRGLTDQVNILIGGIIAAGPGDSNAELIIRAVGPSLQNSGISNAIADPNLELRDANGNLLGFNDDWGTNREKIPTPFQNLYTPDSALRVSLARGNYTALVRPNSGKGIALVEFYDLRASN